MTNENEAYLKKVLKLYNECRYTLSVAFDGDATDEKALAIKRYVSPERALLMQTFVQDLEDKGIHLLAEGRSN